MTAPVAAPTIPIDDPTDGKVQWKWFDSATPAGLGSLTSWINQECKPNRMSSITVMSGQLGQSQSYGIWIFCRFGSGKLGNVVAGSWAFPKGSFQPEALVPSAFVNGHDVVGLLEYSGETNAFYYLRRE